MAKTSHLYALEGRNQVHSFDGDLSGECWRSDVLPALNGIIR
jgi:hypothetical protein